MVRPVRFPEAVLARGPASGVAESPPPPLGDGLRCETTPSNLRPAGQDGADILRRGPPIAGGLAEGLFTVVVRCGFCILLTACSLRDDWRQHTGLASPSFRSSVARDDPWLAQVHGRAGTSLSLDLLSNGILSSLATAESTRLQTNFWDTARDGVSWTIESWSNHAVLLLAEVHNLLCDVREGNGLFASLFERWQKLGERIELHEQSQPLEFQPLAVLDAEPSNENNPFPSVSYMNEAVSAAIQMFDLARLLHILARPEHSHQERAARLVRNGEIAEIYVVRVIANSITNRGAINWANAVQLLHTAGMALVGWIRRKALLGCLEDIQAATGWNTRHNIDALLDWWGWAAPLRQRGQTWREVSEEIGPRQRIGDFLLRMFETKGLKERNLEI